MPVEPFEEVGPRVFAVCRVGFFAVVGKEGGYEGVAPVCAAVAKEVDPVLFFVAGSVVRV